MYHENPIINDLILTIINDGNGSQCGLSYAQRKYEAAHHGLSQFRLACARYNKQRVASGSKKADRLEVIEAAQILFDYYIAHNREIAQS
jgi:hypothetical protein